MNKYTTFTLSLAGFLAMLFPSPLWADDVMKCGDIVFRLERKLFSADLISYRSNGRWNSWCSGKYSRLEIGDDGGMCIIDSNHVTLATDDREKGIDIGEFGLPVTQTMVVDFYLKTFTNSFGSSKVSCQSLNSR